MIKNYNLNWIAIPLLLFIISCAGSSVTREGDKLLKAGAYSLAVEQYQAALQNDQENADLWQKLGIAQFRLQKHDQALKAFRQASLLKPDDGLNVIYRGMIHEQQGEYEQAQQLYQTYLSFNAADEKLEEEIRHRMRWLEDTRLSQLIKQAIAEESKIDVTDIPNNSVAVVRFDASSLPAQYSPIGRGIAELIYNDLSYVEGLKLVERLELSRLQSELALSESEFSDKYNSPRIGRIVGAAKIVTGKISEVAGNEFGLDCGIVDVGPGMTEYPASQQGNVDDLFQMQKQLTLSIIKQLGYELTADIKNKIDEPLTSSFLALIAYSRGLEYADQGLYSLANAEFNAALEEDPKFKLATQALAKYSSLSSYDGTLKPVAEITYLVQQESNSRELDVNRRANIIKRLQDTATQGIQPDEEPYTNPQVEGGRVIVTGRTD